MYKFDAEHMVYALKRIFSNNRLADLTYMHSMASCNSLFPFLLIVLSFVFSTTKGQTVCTYNNKGYAECEFMFWLNWTACDGRDCPLGKEKRLKGICCSHNSLEPSTVIKYICKRNCNFTDSDFEETSM